MKDNYENLDEVFDVEPIEVTKSPIIGEDKSGYTERIEEEMKEITSNTEDIKKDYEYTRGNLYSIIEKGQEALNGILELAQESEMPRAYEVAGQLIKNVADATDKLMQLQQKLKQVEEEKEAKGPTNVTNAMFVGSTSELQKLLKDMGKDK